MFPLFILRHCPNFPRGFNFTDRTVTYPTHCKYNNIFNSQTNFVIFFKLFCT